MKITTLKAVEGFPLMTMLRDIMDDVSHSSIDEKPLKSQVSSADKTVVVGPASRPMVRLQKLADNFTEVTEVAQMARMLLELYVLERFPKSAEPIPADYSLKYSVVQCEARAVILKALVLVHE